MVIGTENSIRLFDVRTNTQVFWILIDERTRTIVITEDNRIYVDSNSAVLGSDLNEAERFCTVTGDAVMTMCEITRDHQKGFCQLRTMN
jgi:hypothetical protein